MGLGWRLGESVFRVIRRHKRIVKSVPDSPKWKEEVALPLGRSILLLFLLLGGLLLGWLKWRDSPSRPQLGEMPKPTINKNPVNFVSRTFDPASPPAEMPPLPAGETAECDSDFVSSARVGARTRRTDATHATVTITQVILSLGLNITIWVPAGASEHVIEHEQGHRQISEAYYETAEKAAERIAAGYTGRQVDIAGADLNAEANQLLQQMAAEITEAYKKELDPEPAQLLYDSITDHSRNEVAVQDAVAHALKNANIEFNSASEPR